MATGLQVGQPRVLCCFSHPPSALTGRSPGPQMYTHVRRPRRVSKSIYAGHIVKFTTMPKHREPSHKTASRTQRARKMIRGPDTDSSLCPYRTNYLRLVYPSTKQQTHAIKLSPSAPAPSRQLIMRLLPAGSPCAGPVLSNACIFVAQTQMCVINKRKGRNQMSCVSHPIPSQALVNMHV